MAVDRAGWLGGVRGFLKQIEITHAPRPDPNTNVVDLPNGAQMLRDAIMAVKNQLVEAQAECGDIEQGWKDVQTEILAAYQKNASRQRDLIHRLTRLQQEWIAVSAEMDMTCTIIPVKVYGSAPAIDPALVDDSQPD